MPEDKFPKCEKTVGENQNSIFCDACNTWLHLKCSGLNKIEFNILSESPDTDWFCKHCFKNIFPFQNLDDKKFRKLIETGNAKSLNRWKSITNKTTGYDKACSVCSETIRVAKTSIPCGNCKHLIHKKCAKLNNFSINNINSHLTEWECESCTTKLFSTLPFIEIEQHELIDLAFNSNFSCKCNSTATSLIKYNNLEKLIPVKFP